MTFLHCEKISNLNLTKYVILQWIVLLMIFLQDNKISFPPIAMSRFCFLSSFNLFCQTTFVTIENGGPLVNYLSDMTENPVKLKLTLTVL